MYPVNNAYNRLDITGILIIVFYFKDPYNILIQVGKVIFMTYRFKFGRRIAVASIIHWNSFENF